MKTLSFCARRRNVAYKVVHFIGKQNFLATTPNVKQKKKSWHPVSLNYLFCTGLTTQGWRWEGAQNCATISFLQGEGKGWQIVNTEVSNETIRWISTWKAEAFEKAIQQPSVRLPDDSSPDQQRKRKRPSDSVCITLHCISVSNYLIFNLFKF